MKHSGENKNPDNVPIAGNTAAQPAARIERASANSLNWCFWAIGKRRPMPKALEVTFSPGAAYWRLYSLQSIFLAISVTSDRGKSRLRAISRGVRLSSTYWRRIWSSTS